MITPQHFFWRTRHGLFHRDQCIRRQPSSLQGALSFFSPCVLPLVPLYVSYLAGGAAVVDAGGVRRYPRGRIFLNTLFFVVGISFAFFLLGLGLTALGSFFSDYQVWFARASGVIILLFGLYQLGLGKSGPWCWSGSTVSPSGWTSWP